MSKCATSEEALAFVREHGVVLVSAKGTVPRLTEAIIGEPIKGSWWAHPQSHHIFTVLAVSPFSSKYSFAGSSMAKSRWFIGGSGHRWFGSPLVSRLSSWPKCERNTPHPAVM